MACRARLECVRQRFLAKCFLSKVGVEPPERCDLILIDDQGKEVSAPSYARQTVEFRKSEKPGIYTNATHHDFKARLADENWGRIVAYSIALPTKSGIDCTCMGGRFQKSRTVTAGDVLRFDKGNLQAQFAGHQLGASAWLNEKFSAFVFEREDFDAPTEFWMGLFAASPARNGYVEQADCIRKRVRWSPGSNGLEAYNSDTLEFVAGPGTWDVSSIGVWSGPDPFADDQPLLLWKRLPFGQRVVEQGEAVVIPKGEYKIG